MKIFGIDPGSQVAGFACLVTRTSVPLRSSDFALLGAGAIKMNRSLKHVTRIGELFRQIDLLLDEFKPDICVIEKAFFGVNVSSAIKLGEARGALIAAATKRGIVVGEITPAEVKRLVVGNGRATKEEVARCLKANLIIPDGNYPFDVTDAVAIALSYGLSALQNQITLIPPLTVNPQL